MTYITCLVGRQFQKVCISVAGKPRSVTSPLIFGIMNYQKSKFKQNAHLWYMYLGPQQKYPSRFEYFGWHVRTIGARILHRQKDTVIPKYPTAKTLFTGGIKHINTSLIMYFLKCRIRNSTYLFAVGSVVSPCNTNVTIWHYTSRQGVDQNKTAIEAKMWSSKINSID